MSTNFSDLENVLPKLPNPFVLSYLKTKKKTCRRLIYKRVEKATDNKTKLKVVDHVTTHLHVLSFNEINLFALESFIYQSDDDQITTLFISKADTSGYYNEDEKKYPLSIREITTALIRNLIRYHVDNQSSKLRVCLFAKAERQYLFPLSGDNTNKHILWDSNLVKWWLKTIDPLYDEFRQLKKARLQIPGSDDKSIKSFFPKDSKLPWTVGDVFWNDDDSSAKLPAVKCLPRFPDDPKTRFLDFLVSEKRALKVSRQQFWIELQGRQEFRLGSVVGIIGMEGYLKPSSTSKFDQQSGKLLTNKEYDMLREALISKLYTNQNEAKEASESFNRRVAEDNKIKLTGKKKTTAKRYIEKIDQTPAVNVLGASMVRKKPKVK